MNLNSNSKNEIRRELRGKIAALTQEQRDKKSVAIVERVRAFLTNLAKSNPALTCGGFLSLETEPNLRTLFEKQKIDWAFPKLSQNTLVFARPGTDLTLNTFNVEEPNGDEVRTESLQAILVPGLGFDENLNRIGRGKGFYDRALQNYWGLKIGICFTEQFVSRLPLQENHDVPVDYVVTDSFIYKAVEKQKQ